MSSVQKTVKFEELRPRDKIVVLTKSRTYTIVVTDSENRMAMVQDERRFPEGKESFVQVFELNHGLRFVPQNYHGGIATSRIQDIRLNGQQIAKVD